MARTVRERLAHHHERLHLVRIHRSPEHADVVDGFVVGLGKKWVLLAVTADGGYLDGWQALRMRDVERVVRVRNHMIDVARSCPEWPPRAPGATDHGECAVDLDSTERVLLDLAEHADLVGIQRERTREGLWIGRVHEIDDGRLWLHEIDPDARWHDEPLGYRLRTITSVEIGSRYERALESAHRPPLQWYAVRQVLAWPTRDGERIYEESITVWQAPDADTAVELARDQARENAELTGEPLPFTESFRLFEPPAHGVEVFSLLRESTLDGEAYLARFLDDGDELRSDV